MFPVLNCDLMNMVDLCDYTRFHVPSSDHLFLAAADKNDCRAIGPNAKIIYSKDHLLRGNQPLIYIMHSITTDAISQEWGMGFCNVMHNSKHIKNRHSFPNTKAEFKRDYQEMTNAFPENTGTSK